MIRVARGIYNATAVIVGNCIGAQNVPLAKRFISLIAKVSLGAQILLSTLLVSTRSQIISCYTEDERLRVVLMPIILLIALSSLFDGFQNFLQGPMRALGL